MCFVIDSVVESDAEMQPTNAPRPSRSQQDITSLRVGTKRVAFAGIFWLFAEGQLEAIRGVVLRVVVIRLFVGGYSLSARNSRAFCDPSSGR